MKFNKYLFLNNILIFLLTIYSIYTKNDTFFALLFLYLVLNILVFIVFYIIDLEKFFLIFFFVFFLFSNIQGEIVPFFFISPIDILMVPLTIYMWYKLLYKKNTPVLKNFIYIYLFLFMFILIGFIWSKNIALNIRLLIFFFYGLGVFKLFIDNTKTSDDIIYITKLFAITALYPIFLAFVELLLNRDITPLYKLGNIFTQGIRVSGPMSVNSLGYYLSFLLPFLFYSFEIKIKKRLIFTMIILVLATIFFTGSRSALIFAFINTVGYILIKILFEKSKTRIYYFAFGFIVFVLFTILGYLMLQNRLQGDVSFSQDYSLLIRFFLWKASIALIIKNPIWGIGFGNFFFYHRETLNPLAVFFLRAGDHPHAHNIILHILTEMGFIGLIGVSLFSMWVVYRLVQRIKYSDSSQEKINIGIFLVTCFGFFGSQQFDLLMASPSHSRSILLVFMFLAILHNIILDKKIMFKL